MLSFKLKRKFSLAEKFLAVLVLFSIFLVVLGAILKYQHPTESEENTLSKEQVEDKTSN